jgi:hypothetical protein
LKVIAVFAGLLTDIVGSIFVGVGLAILIGIVTTTSSDPSVTCSTLRQSFPVRLIGLFGTTLSTVLGGYVAGRLAKTNSIPNSLVVGLLSLLLALVTAATFPGVTPLWKIIAGSIVTIPAAVLGGYIAAKSTGAISASEEG